MPSLTATTTHRGSFAGAGLEFSAKASSDMSPGGGGVAGNRCVCQRAAARSSPGARVGMQRRQASVIAPEPGYRSTSSSPVGHEQALVCPVNGARCELVACIDVGCTGENADFDAERAA